MSWGERSCLKPCRVPEDCKITTCNVDCPAYIWDKKTKPDSKPKSDLDMQELEQTAKRIELENKGTSKRNIKRAMKKKKNNIFNKYF